jgi:3-isopropylmalate dehydratase small subunit
MLNGTVFKFGDNVDTDVIIPARYLNAPSPEELAQHCMEDIDSSFVQRVQPGDIMVGGWNFGCGSSREHAPIAIQASGVSCVIAASFARIFYRNAINIGFPILESPEAAERIAALPGNRDYGAFYDPARLPDRETLHHALEALPQGLLYADLPSVLYRAMTALGVPTRIL